MSPTPPNDQQMQTLEAQRMEESHAWGAAALELDAKLVATCVDIIDRLVALHGPMFDHYDNSNLGFAADHLRHNIHTAAELVAKVVCEIREESLEGIPALLCAAETKVYLAREASDGN